MLPIIPDADVIAFKFGIPYAAAFGHRGFSHSILFAFLLALIVMLTAFREISFGEKDWYKYLIYFFVITLSHSLLDALTNGGLGVGLLIPLTDERYFFPFRPIAVSPISLRRFLDGSAMYVLLSEIVWVWIPLCILYFGKIAIQKLKKSVSPNS